MYRLTWTSHFTRVAKRFSKRHPELRGQLVRVLRDLERDPTQPHLRLHPLRGKLSGLHAVSITYSFRITLTLKIAEREIVLLDIGSHDDVYG